VATIIRWGLWATALVPLIIFRDYISPFHFGKVVVFRSLIEILLVLFIVLIWQNRAYRPKLDVIGWTFLGFTLAYTLATVTSVAPYFSFWGTLERMGGLFSFWHYFIFYVMLVSVMRERRHWWALLDIMIFVGVLSGIYGFLQKTDLTFILGSGGRVRPFGTIGNPALFAGYQILVAFLAGIFSLREGISPVHRWWYRGAAVLMFLAVFSTAVRGSLLGVVVGVAVFVLLLSAFNRSRRTKFIVFGTGVAIGIFALFALVFHNTSFVQNSPYLRRITDFSSESYTVQTRFWAWNAGLQGWSETPKTVLVGWGPENFNVPFSKYFNPKFFRGPGSETFFDRAHNMFMEVLVTMGLVGLLTYLALFGAVFWTCWKLMQRGGEWRLYGMGFTAMTVAYIIHNAFIFDTSTNFIVFFTLAGFLSSLAVQSSGSGVNTKKPAHRPAPLGAGRLSVLLILLIPALIVMARTNIRPTQANYATTRGIIAGWQGQFAEAMSKYEEAVAYETFGVYEERHRLAQYLLEVNIQIEGVPDIFRQALEFAISEVEKNILLNEQDYLPHLYLARMHIILGQNDPDSDHNAIALSHTDRALEISPTFVRTYFEIAQAYLNRKEFVQAYEWFAKAQQLNPEVGITYWYLGIVRAQLGDPEGAIEFINEAVQKGYTLSQEEVERVINIYLQLGDLDSVVALLEQLIERAPDRPDYWASLAAAHIQAGNNEDAIYAIRQAMELDEDYRAEGERLLQELGAE